MSNEHWRLRGMRAHYPGCSIVADALDLESFVQPKQALWESIPNCFYGRRLSIFSACNYRAHLFPGVPVGPDLGCPDFTKSRSASAVFPCFK